MAEDIAGYKHVGSGYSVVPVGRVEGTVVNVTQPLEMIKLMRDPEKLKSTVVVTPGGTTTFVAPLLNKHPAGIITYAGSPESHLGIVGRTMRLPIIMTLDLVGVESLPDGTAVLLDCGEKLGQVYVKEGVEAGAEGSALAR